MASLWWSTSNSNIGWCKAAPYMCISVCTRSSLLRSDLRLRRVSFLSFLLLRPRYSFSYRRNHTSILFIWLEREFPLLTQCFPPLRVSRWLHFGIQTAQGSYSHYSVISTAKNTVEGGTNVDRNDLEHNQEEDRKPSQWRFDLFKLYISKSHSPNELYRIFIISYPRIY